MATLPDQSMQTVPFDPAPVPVAPPPSAAAAAQHARYQKLAKRLTAALAVVFAFMAAGAIGLGLYAQAHEGRIYQGVHVGDVDLSGMTRVEAREALLDGHAASLSQPVDLVTPGDGQHFTIEPATSGITFNLDGTVDEAFAFGREGSFWTRSAEWAGAILQGKSVDAALDVDTARLDASLAMIAPAVARPADDARVDMKAPEGPTIVPEFPGIAFDVTSTRQLVIAEVANEGSHTVEVVTQDVPAAVMVDDLAPSLESARAAVAEPMVVSGPDGQSWSLTVDQLTSIVSVEKGTTGIVVSEPAISDFVAQVSSEATKDPVDADVTVGEMGTLEAVPAEDGIAVNEDETEIAIATALRAGTHAVDLSYTTVPPQITTVQAEAAAKAGEEMLSRGVVLSWEGDSMEFTRSDLMTALTIRFNPGQAEPFTYGFDPDILASTMQPAIDAVLSEPIEPQLRLVNGKVTIVSEGKPGLALDVEKTAAAVSAAALTGDGTAKVVTEKTDPSVTPANLADIRLDDVLAEASTSYASSSDARRQNVETASKLMDGWLVAPGETFSYAQHIGTVTEDQGFVTGYGIVADPSDPSGQSVTTAPVVGGGICQISTTIFQAGFWSGLDVVERYSHPYWIRTYGDPPRGMKGLDAMVNIDGDATLDMKMTNNTGNWIAIQVVADGSIVTARVLGTATGWNVQVNDPVITNIVSPPVGITYTDTPELPAGSELQVEHAQDGFTASVTRIVTDANGTELDRTTIDSTYAPSKDTVLIGTG